MLLFPHWLMANGTGGGMCLFSREQLCRRSANNISSESWKAAATLKIPLISLSPCSSHFMVNQWGKTRSADKAAAPGTGGPRQVHCAERWLSVVPNLLINSISGLISVICSAGHDFERVLDILEDPLGKAAVGEGKGRQGLARCGGLGVFSDAHGKVGGRRSPFTHLSWKWWGRVL